MAHKRKRTKPDEPRHSSTQDTKWSDEVVEELLSYLNSQIPPVAFVDPIIASERRGVLEGIDQELSRHLNDFSNARRKEVHNYSAEQIRDKLRRLFDRRGLNDYRNDDWRVIYGQGFACLDWSHDHDQRMRMVNKSKDFKDQWEVEFMYSPRKTRAEYKVNGSVQKLPQRGLRDSPRTSKRGRRCKTPYAAESLPTQQHSANNDSLSLTKSGEATMKVENRGRSPCVLIRPDRGGMEQIAPWIRDSEEVSETEPEAFQTPPRGLRPNGPNSAKSPSTSLPSTQTNGSTAAIDFDLEIDFWKSKYRQTQKNFSKLVHAHNAVSAKWNVFVQAPDESLSYSDCLVKHKVDLDRLLSARELREYVQNLRNDMSTEPSHESILAVSKLMREIENELPRAFEGQEVSCITELRSWSENLALKPLVDKAFGLDCASLETFELLERWCETPWLQQYGLLTLCGAALAGWIFQRTQADILFDRYQNVGTRSCTTRYSEAIRFVQLKDPALARSIEIKVHKKITEENEFKHFRKLRAQDLARQFLRAIAPLCGQDPNDYDHHYDVENRSFSLCEIFCKAMEVQSKLSVTGWLYECAWHKPGALFDPTTMNSYRIHETGASGGSTVGLTLVPGINQVNANKISIDFDGFEGRSGQGDEAVNLVQAVVLCGIADLH